MRRPSRLRCRLIETKPGWRAMKRARSAISDIASFCFSGSHRPLRFGPSWLNDLVVAGRTKALSAGLAKLFDALFHDAYRLTHLFHAHEVAIVAVAVLADRDVEIKLGVAFIGLRLAQVPCRSGAAHHHAGKSPGPRLGELDQDRKST